MKVKMLVAQSHPMLCNPMDCNLPGSSVHGILQTRILEWVTMLSSRVSSQPRDQTQVSLIAGEFFTTEGKPYLYLYTIEYYSAIKRMKYYHLQ